jgi:enamine deaminase RidA (YjgF/YER057c/UK114 family)
MTITRLDPGKRLSEAVAHNGTLYLAGQVASTRDAAIDVQTREVLAAVDELLRRGGSSKAKLLSVNVYLANMADFAGMNAVYDAWVDGANPPTRATVEARLADPALKVEVTAIAAISD